MPESFTQLGIYVVGPLVAALLLSHLYRRFKTSYLLHWTMSYAALAAFHLAAAAVILGTDRQAIALVLSIAGGAAGYGQLGLVGWGCLGVADRKAMKTRDAYRVLLVLAVAGMVAGAIPFLIGHVVAVHRYLNLALHALASAATFFAGAVILRRMRGEAFTVAALAMAASSAASIFAFIVIMRGLVSGSGALPLLTLVSADLAGTALFVLGSILAVLEDEHESASAAASEVEHLAYHDTVTGLPNRSLFSDRLAVALAHAQRHRHKLAVLFLDIDRFKQINDSLGHTFGDRMLRTIATRITGAVREEDTVARFGGDEFTVLIHIIGKIEDAGKIATKVLESLKAPIVIDGRDFMVTSSIGISIYPVDGNDGETLIRNADTAMYRAKDAGRNAYQYYAATMNQRALEALELDNGLRRAMLNNEFVLYYQPLVDVPTGKVFGVEALIRWNHPEHGILRPERFIAAAEQSGLIIPIGRWVLHEACNQAAEWHRRGHRIVMAVNLSARQFQAPDLIEQVAEALEASRLRANFLEIEITEGYAMKDVEKAVKTLHELKKLGVRIAIDDFGTGYSCLSYLKQFPIDTLKLDGSFVRDITSPQDQQIALGVIALAHSLSLKVIAEGVETIGQLAFLRDNACDRLQGYLFSRPMPPGSFDSFLNQGDLLRQATVH